MIENVILDRDGVINQDSDLYIKNPTEFILIDNAIDALYLFHKHNIKIFIATNQSGIGRKLYDLKTYLAITNKLLNAIKAHKLYNQSNIISAIYYCPHSPEQRCTCRKPLPGMIEKIQSNHHIDLQKTAVIGDSMRDLDAADAAGCKFKFLVKTGKGIATLEKGADKLSSQIIFNNLFDCAQYICKHLI